jgi:hypothetical protein
MGLGTVVQEQRIQLNQRSDSQSGSHCIHAIEYYSTVKNDALKHPKTWKEDMPLKKAKHKKTI